MNTIIKFKDFKPSSIIKESVDIDTNSDSIGNSPISILVINGCEHGSDVEKKIEEFQNKIADCCSIIEIPLYQLNIQNTKKDVKDGMVQIYNALEKANALIIACEVNKGKMSDQLETAISRIKNYYTKNELKNKIFGSIILGNDEKVKNDMVLTAINDLSMIVSADCFFSAGKDSNSNIKTFSETIKSLSNLMIPVSDIENEGTDIETDIEISDSGLEEIENENETEIENELNNDADVDVDTDIDIKNFDEFTENSDSESDSDSDSEDKDIEFKSFDEFNETENDEDAETETIEEDEERLIDNQDGTITQITKNDTIKESTILSFEQFISSLK